MLVAMSDPGWRRRIRWLRVHPDRPQVRLVQQAGGLALPETGLRAEVWTADASATLPALERRVGFDAVLLGCLAEEEDPSARVQRATLMATPRGGGCAPASTRRVGR